LYALITPDSVSVSITYADVVADKLSVMVVMMVTVVVAVIAIGKVAWFVRPTATISGIGRQAHHHRGDIRDLGGNLDELPFRSVVLLDVL